MGTINYTEGFFLQIFFFFVRLFCLLGAEKQAIPAYFAIAAARYAALFKFQAGYFLSKLESV